MTTIPPELHRPLATDRADSAEIVVEANEAERQAVAARLQLPSLGALHARFRLRRLPHSVFEAEGTISARLTQICVVTLEPFESTLKEEFRLRFVPDGRETELDIEGVDEVPYEGGMIDLGEAAVEQLALSLDPYPKKPGATLPESAEDRSANPFAALASRRLQ